MPTISKVRFTNVQYEAGNKRYQDEMFHFDGHNGALLLENGGGKTVFIQTLIQCILPNSTMAERKMRDTLDVTMAPAHIAVEWILEESPREYAVTCISFFMSKDGLSYHLYCFDYREGSPHSIQQIPFVKETAKGKRAATKDEIHEYYQSMSREYGNAHTFPTIREYQRHLEEQYRIVPGEWEAMLKINGSEGGVDEFFEGCKTMTQLVDKLLIPTVEQGLSVKGTQDFYKLFDNHREHLREYLDLGEQLKEYRRIDEEMQGLVALYKRSDEEERAYRNLQGKGKALWLRMATEREETDRSLAVLAEQKTALEEETILWNIRRDGFGVWKKKLDYEQAELVWKGNEPVFLQAQEAELVAHRRYRSMQYLSYRREAEGAEDQVRAKEEQVAQLAQDTAAGQVEQELENCLRRAAFLCDKRIANLDREQQAVDKELDRRRELLAKSTEHMQGQLKQRDELLRQQSTFRERRENVSSQMREIEAEILLDRDAQVPLELQKWSKEVTKVEQATLDCMEMQAKAKRDQQTLLGQIDRAQEELERGKKEMNDAQLRLENMERQEQSLMQNLLPLLPDFSEMHSLHLKEDTIRHRLETQLALLDRNVEESLERERVAFRFYDLYKDNATFSADPELERWVEKVHRDLPSVELGTTYVLRVAKEEEQSIESLYELYPLWPMTIVAIGADLEKAKQRLQALQHQWTHPIHLVTTAQAHAFLQGSWQAGSVLITPSQWLSLTESHSFRDWLDEQKTRAEEEKENRKYFERDRQKHATLADQVHHFFTAFPYELVKGWREQKEAGMQMMRTADRLLDALQMDGEQIEGELQRLGGQLSLLERQSEDLSRRIQGALKWERLEESRQIAADDLELVDQTLRGVEHALSQLQQQAEVLRSEADEHQKRWNDLQVDLNSAKREPLYLRVSSKPREESQESLLVITARIDALDDQLGGVVRQKRELEAQREEWSNRARRARQEMRALLVEHVERVEQDFAYSGDLSTALPREQEVWQQALSRYRDVKNEHDQWHEKMKRAKMRAEDAAAQFEDTYETSLPDFGDQTVERIEQQLQQQIASIRDRQQHCQKEIDQTQRLRDELENVYRRLDMLSQKKMHGFAFPELPPVLLREEEEQRFPYMRMKFVEQLQGQLDDQADRAHQAGNDVRQRRQKFERYLENVQAEKIRQQTLDGLKLKTTYREVLEWSEAMHERILHVMSIVEQQQRESDQQIQHVIVHLHTHLKNICHELKEIPKMTRIRFEGGGVKDIFDFTVPEWKEEEGLLALRRHLEWMMTELEQDKFRNDLGQEDREKVRKKVEEWLHPVQLLQVINKTNEIKARCRKVTNDKRVAGTYTEWPDTEKWSGGEKWSKNMTLLLGILNYLAEKRGHLRVGKGNHRTVICDNPFGKASSDHVLSPVFHIAQQLGFQFIALTAHAEGKFLRDYFPVLYSCRLRQTQDPSIMVMNKEREIHKAYFQDHAPQSLERLGQEEQLSLL